jgi:hypothetical protein
VAPRNGAESDRARGSTDRHLPQQVGRAAVNVNAVNADATTITFGHSGWAYDNAVLNGAPSDSQDARSIVCDGIGCSTLGNGADATGFSPDQKLRTADSTTKTPAYSTPLALPVLPKWVWNPNDTNAALPAPFPALLQQQQTAD